MMTTNHALLFTELRVIEIPSIETKAKTLEFIDLAVMENENLKALGYQLTEEGMLKLALAIKENKGSLNLYQKVQEFEPAIEVDPMYKGFPLEVLNMDELDYRTHQMIHYLTTYGLEIMTGTPVKTGWLPESTPIERQEDERIIPLKTIDLLTPEEVDNKVIKDLIGRKERLLPKELKIAKFVLLRTKQEIKEIPFKENIGTLFADILLNGTLEERSIVFHQLQSILKHSGDVLDLLEEVVKVNKYKQLKTSVKRGFVQLLESFSKSDLEENLSSNKWSNAFLGKKGKKRAINRNIALIDYLSFNRFATKPHAISVVNELKGGTLLSWNQLLERTYAKKAYRETLALLSERPGILFRQINRLIKLGVDPKLVRSVVQESAGTLKTQSIVSALNNYSGENEEVNKVFMAALMQNLKSKELKDLFSNKKVFLKENSVDFANSKIEITDKNKEGGYIQSGIAIKIPDEVEILRFFTYWNDKKRIDIDLHGVALKGDGSIAHCGWNGDFRDGGMVHSGDITHSNASEYIDFSFKAMEEADVKFIQMNINSFLSIPFNKIDTVFTGLMGVSKLKEKANLHDSKNVLFRHDLEYNDMALDYAFVDIEKRLLRIIGKHLNLHNDTNLDDFRSLNLSMKTYVGLLALTQGATFVESEEEADLVLGIEKEDKENYVNLIDENFFMDVE